MLKKSTETTMPAVERTSVGLRDALFDELQALREGRSNSAKANAVAKLCGTVVETVRLEMEVVRHTEKFGADSIEALKAAAPSINLAAARK